MSPKVLGTFKILWAILMHIHFRRRSSELEALLGWSQVTLSRGTCPERQTERVDVLDILRDMTLDGEENA
jgi:hypothetical protein